MTLSTTDTINSYYDLINYNSNYFLGISRYLEVIVFLGLDISSFSRIIFSQAILSIILTPQSVDTISILILMPFIPNNFQLPKYFIIGHLKYVTLIVFEFSAL